MNDRLFEIARRLILAEKHLSHVDTIYPASMFHYHESRIMPLELPALPPIPMLPAQLPKQIIQAQVQVQPAPAFTQKPEPAQQITQKMPLLNLGKLNPLIMDDSIKAIECLGAGINLKVKKNTMTDTNVQLTENEILGIINIFANAAKMPFAPVMKIDFQNMTLNAFVIPAMGSRFFLVKKS